METCILPEEVAGNEWLTVGTAQHADFRTMASSLWKTWQTYSKSNMNIRNHYLVLTLLKYLDLEEESERQWLLERALKLGEPGRPPKRKKTQIIKTRQVVDKLFVHPAIKKSVEIVVNNSIVKEGESPAQVFSCYLARQRTDLRRDPVLRLWRHVRDMSVDIFQ